MPEMFSEELWRRAEVALNKEQLQTGDTRLRVRLHSIDIWKHRDPSIVYLTRAPHHHEYGEIHYVQRGVQVYRVADRDQRVEAGCMLYIPMNTTHFSVSASDDLQKIGFRVTVSEDQYERFAAVKQRLTDGRAILLRDTRYPAMLLETIAEEAAHQREDWLCVVNSLLSAFMMRLSRYAAGETPEDAADRQENRSPQRRVMAAENYIRENISANISCEAVADHMKLSVKQLGRIVRQYRGQTLSQWLCGIKFEIACALLQQSGKSVREIADYLCFSDASSFSRFFKNHAGLYPVEWLRRHPDAPEFDHTKGDIYDT